MKMSETIKPISYLKANAAEIIRNFNKQEGIYIITQNGEAKAVLQDIRSYEAMQSTLALLKILALSSESLHQGKVEPIRTAFADIRKKVKEKTE